MNLSSVMEKTLFESFNISRLKLMTTTLTNDPISQLPEPYRVAWEILRESLGYEDMLRHVLTAAQAMAKATWGLSVAILAPPTKAGKRWVKLLPHTLGLHWPLA